MQKVIVIFPSTYAAIKAERLCLQTGTPCQVIPVPRNISSDCGIALEIDQSGKKSVEKLFMEHTIDFKFASRTSPS